MDKINVIGLGYIGLPTALMFASNGISVVGTDINDELVNKLNNGELDFSEEHFKAYFKRARDHISFSLTCEKADVYIVAVATPYEKTTRKVDVTYLVKAIRSMLEVCEDESILVIESTISPGTIDTHIRPIVENNMKKINKKIHIAHAPERIIPGNMFYELEHNPRVIGVDDEHVGDKLKKLYSAFCKNNIEITDIKTAEMSKVVENTYRDINIAFANELDKICREGGLDVYEVIRIANMHPRVKVLQPGPGVGGHCISVDPWFLVGDYPGLANIILAARKINDSMPEYVLMRLNEIMKQTGNCSMEKVGFYGLTYKEDIDDTRDSPTLQLIERMQLHLAHHPKVYDPMVKKQIIDGQYLNFDLFLHDIDVIVIMVGHKHIKENRKSILDKIILDTRNIGIDRSFKVFYL